MKKISRKDDRFEDEEDELDTYQSKHKATFVGTAEYVSPELLEDDQCGPEADLWALGCIVYKMFTGKTPFIDSTEYLVFQKVKSCKIDIPEVIFLSLNKLLLVIILLQFIGHILDYFIMAQVYWIYCPISLCLMSTELRRGGGVGVWLML